MDMLANSTRLAALRSGLAGPIVVVDVRAAHPLGQCHRVVPEARRDLPDRDTRFTNAGDVISELLQIRLGHDDIFPAPRVSQVRRHLYVQ